MKEDQDVTARLAAMEKRLADLTEVMTRLDKALTEPHPGYGDRGLLEWMAASAVESHARAAAGEALIRVAKYVTAIGVIISSTIAAMKFGSSSK